MAAGSLFAGAMTASAEDAEEKVLHIGWNSDMQTMDVHKTTSNYAIPLCIFDRLFEVQLNDDGSTEIAKSLVDDYSISEDGLTYSFTLKDGIVFSDGSALTSEDVQYTFTRMFALDESVQTDFTSSIVGAQALIDGETETLEGFKVIDDLNFEITLDAPYAAFLSVLATPTCCIFSSENVEEAGEDFGIVPEKTIGSGPYVVAEWIPNDSVTLKANPLYWGEPASASTVVCKIYPEASSMNMAFQNGDIDILDCDYIDSAIVDSVYKTAYADSVVYANRLATSYLTMNENVEPMNDVKVRKAIQMAIDRQSILDAIYGGEGTVIDGIYPAGSIGFTEENQGWLQYDPEEAARIISEVPGASAVRLELAANSESEIRTLRMLEMIADDLSAIGLDVSVVSYDDDSRMYLRKAGRLMAYSGEWSADFNDPDNFIYTFFGSRAKTLDRSGNYSNEEVIGRIAAARTIQDQEERLAEYAELEKILIRDEAVWVPLYSTEHLFILGDRVEGFTPFWAGWGSLYLKDIILKPEAR
jgi:peptide/nickel transport system substrate-binding protein